jgi:hypothetical protein
MDSPNAALAIKPKYIRIFASLVVFCVSLTILFLSMRAVMGIGGFCAEGGPYQIETHCPKGVAPLAALTPLTMIVSIFVYLASGAVNGVLLMWSGIFLSLGWNFMEFAFRPPQGDSIVYSWVLCGVMFIAMGLAPFAMVGKTMMSVLRQNKADRGPIEKPDSQMLLLHFIGIALGIGVGVYLFNFFTA